MTSEDYIRRTFLLAARGLGSTWPNPLVGVVIVKNHRIIGEGFHKVYGSDHAELDALKNCSESPEGSTIYVNLEPCCHTHKQTPPCAQRLIQEKIKKVVVSNLDPNPSVNGKGVELLRAHGIEVEHGVLEAEGEVLNEVFFHVQRNRRPFVHLKLATTLDGRIALPSGESQWITGDKARAHVHLLRSQHQAIMVGAETARRDNPELSVRLPDYQGRQPWRIILSQSGKLDQTLKIFTDSQKEKTLVFQNIDEAMAELFAKNIINIFLEGGATLATSFMKRKLVNRISLYMNPSFLGSGPSALADLGLEKLNQRPHLKQLQSEWMGDDFYLTGRL